jgi:hypothetical protein
MKTRILCFITFFKNRAIYENVKKYGGARGVTNDVTTWLIRVACWISKATCTHAHARAHASEHTHAFARAYAHTQLCNIYSFSTTTIIRERASLLRYTYIACLVCNILTMHNKIILARKLLMAFRVSTFKRFKQ